MIFSKNSEIGKFLKSEEFLAYKLPETVQARMASIMDDSNLIKISSSDYLVAFSSQSHSYCVGCVDMVDSTRISASIPPYKLPLYYELFLNSMAKIIGKFGGRVIKNIGDCLLYYFPNSMDSKISGFIECLDCGIAMCQVQSVLCNQLTTQKLPYLNYRISADYGEVLLMSTTDSSSLDMIGPPVNMCSKINRYAGTNEFVIGGDLYELVKKLSGYRFQSKQSCNVGFKFSYPVYSVET